MVVCNVPAASTCQVVKLAQSLLVRMLKDKIIQEIILVMPVAVQTTRIRMPTRRTALTLMALEGEQTKCGV